jgi:ATP-binding cassette subfamily B protein
MTQKNVMSSYALAEGNYVDTMNGISTIKAHGQESFFEKFNQKIYSAFQTQLFNLNKINIKLSLISDVMGVIFILSIFSVTSLYVLNKTLLVGELVAIASMSRSIIPALGRLVATNIQIQEVRVVFDRMFEFTDIEPEFENSDKESHQLKWESLELNNITFRFIGRSQLLTDVSLTVNRGEIITILGESGCGKSTLLQVLQRFYEKENGEIKVNGLPFKDLTVPAWRSIIGVVPQEIKIFNGNLLYNICLSEVKEDLQKGIELCSNLGFTDFFEKLPQGLGTLVGEEGVNLSGGQKQLVAIARVLFKRPQLLLLDEVTSAMDNNTENFVLKLLEKLKNNLGIVMVTHRIKIAKNSDRIYILENGAIKLAGTANELMKTNNFFSNSYKELIA